jgi:hypothetical protein
MRDDGQLKVAMQEGTDVMASRRQAKEPMGDEVSAALAAHQHRRELSQDELGGLEKPAALMDSPVPRCQQDRLLTEGCPCE